MKQTPKNIKERILKLKKEITRLRDLYNKKDMSVLSDEALDSLKHELNNLEKKYPSLKTKDSPTQNVSGTVKKGFKKIKHKIRQWSLSDVFNREELVEFDERIRKSINSHIKYFVEEKIDGVKVILEYIDGELITASTRGDGIVGEDITENVLTINDIPKKLKKNVDVIVEGELYITEKELKRINKIRKKNGEEEYANPRNLVAGTVRQLDSNVVCNRNINSFIYNIASGDKGIRTQEEELNFIKKLGFVVNSNYKLCSSIDEIVDFWKKRNNKKDKLDYWIDGIVIKLNDIEGQRKLGYTGKAPRYAVAFKFPAEQVTTIVREIVFQVGRTGVITPVANLEPVLIAGTVVKRATLHNEDQIKRLDVRIGDTIVIQKAGDIIPEIVSVVVNLREKSKKFIWPNRIEDCGGDGKIERVKGGVAWRCVNKNSFELNVRKISHFTSKGAFNIEGLGERTVRQLLISGLIKDYVDIFILTKNEISELEGFKEKSAQNLIDSINKSKNVTLARLLYGLGIEGVGIECANILASKFKTIEKIFSAPVETLRDINGVGKVLAHGIFSFAHNKNEIDRLKEVSKCLKVVNVDIRDSHKLLGKKIVVTGRIEGYDRIELHNLLRSFGAQISTTISKNVDYVFSGHKSGSKLDKAKSLGIQIVKKNEIDKLIKK